MRQDDLTAIMQRAGIRSRRELSRLTGIAHSTLDEIFAHPASARGYQIRGIVDACGMSDREAIEVFTIRR